MENICLFTQTEKDQLSFQILNYVFENNITLFEKTRIESVYKVFYVYSGSGKIILNGNEYFVKKDDLFFILPSFKYYISEAENLKLMYVSFIGRKGNMMIDKLNINSKNFVFSNAEKVVQFCYNGFEIAKEVSNWMAESVLLYTFSFLAHKIIVKTEKAQYTDIINKTVEYINAHFYDCNLNLKSIAEHFFYNPKYLSAQFIKQLKIGISDYIATIRIQHAISLMNSGIRNIGEISFSCGFLSTQYFSKVFKKFHGLSPTEFRKKL